MIILFIIIIFNVMCATMADGMTPWEVLEFVNYEKFSDDLQNHVLNNTLEIKHYRILMEYALKTLVNSYYLNQTPRRLQAVLEFFAKSDSPKALRAEAIQRSGGK